MSSAETQSILRRKAALGSQEHEARAMSVAKAMRQTIAKLGKELFEMPLSAIGIVTEDRKATDLAEILEDTALLTLLEGNDGKVGAAIIGADIVGGLIQQQTMGCVSAPSLNSRKMTHTDAAMCAPLLNALFERVAPMLEIEAEKKLVSGYRFGARFDDARALGIALDVLNYFVVRLTLDMSGGIRQGELTLILPKVVPANASLAGAPDQSDGETTGAGKMNDIAMGLPTELNMVLCRLSLELAQVEQFAVGEAINLPHSTFPETEIVTETGVVIGSGTLGQIEGMRALRLKREPIHATQPRRRESDLPELDLPEITALPAQDSSRLVEQRKPDVEDFVVDTGAGLPALKENAEYSNEVSDEIGAVETNLTVTPPDINDFPELDDFPDLADLPQLAQMG